LHDKNVFSQQINSAESNSIQIFILFLKANQIFIC